MTIEATILGVGSANPMGGMGHSATFLRFNDQPFLLDCGEGTQFRLLEHRLHIFKVEYILITHLHGDHFLGLPGLINTLNLNGRNRPLTVIAPVGMKRILDLHFEISGFKPDFPFAIWEMESDTPQNVLQLDHLTIRAVPLDHRIPCYGYVFEQRITEKNVNIEKCQELDLPHQLYSKIKAGEDISWNDHYYPNGELTLPDKKPLKFSYLTDTRYAESIVPYVKDSDLMIHEATFLKQLDEKANATGHSTSIQAAEIAARAKAGKLVLSHYSSRYTDGKAHEEEARTVFKEAYAAYPGMKVVV